MAQQVAEKKRHSDVRPLFREARDVTGRKPKILVTDGAENFSVANRKEYYSHFKEDNTVHIRDITFHHSPHNNKIERFNGELRDTEKVMRSLKTENTPILKGMQIFHNYVRPHMALDGKTPSEATGIKVEGENRWMTIIQNAAKG